jgi:hypothetical protein
MRSRSPGSKPRGSPSVIPGSPTVPPERQRETGQARRPAPLPLVRRADSARGAEPGGGVGARLGDVGARTPTPDLRCAPARPSPQGGGEARVIVLAARSGPRSAGRAFAVPRGAERAASGSGWETGRSDRRWADPTHPAPRRCKLPASRFGAVGTLRSHAALSARRAALPGRTGEAGPDPGGCVPTRLIRESPGAPA